MQAMISSMDLVQEIWRSTTRSKVCGPCISSQDTQFTSWVAVMESRCVDSSFIPFYLCSSKQTLDAKTIKKFCSTFLCIYKLAYFAPPVFQARHLTYQKHALVHLKFHSSIMAMILVICILTFF
ncbi:hypothetical protein Ancab_024230 [Ancistrocladus abbreviatus]